MCLPAIGIFIGEDLFDVSNGENEVCLAEHAHAGNEPAHDPPLQIHISKQAHQE